LTSLCRLQLHLSIARSADFSTVHILQATCHPGELQ
jgi:hypothetical protein